ncbi:sugar phosphate isomerase/epimerase family protein [Natronococcus roseus]|uniref:sugar phosphate isomerase/epimerase family protein n=1 Tax=Natronococcus roseus TaxID=1052014 RepID=UPI00374D0E26
MGIGYTTMMYDEESIRTGISDISACQYDGVEIGAEKVEHVGPETIRTWLEEYDLQMYCMMTEWPVDEAAVERICDSATLAGEVGASYYGFLPPERHREDDGTLSQWLEEIGAAAAKAGVTPLLHHHGATMIEQPDEIEYWLEHSPENFELLFDTAHYYPYGSVVKGIKRFADDIAYIHFKDVDPPAEFDDHATALSSESYHLDNVINYFRAFTDLGEGVLDFEDIYRTLRDIGYDGHITVEIENQTEPPLIHAKKNVDVLMALTDRR